MCRTYTDREKWPKHNTAEIRGITTDLQASCWARPLLALARVESRDVVVELVPAGARLPTMAARIDERAWEVAILYVLPQVAAIRTDLEADRAPVGPGPRRRKLFNVGIQNLIRI
jgi:hypothetical protein